VRKSFRNIIWIIIGVISSTGTIPAQLSPGELSTPHAQLEGLTNCTKCHILGEKISSEKCIDCHKEIRDRISERKGYHASSEVTGKECVTCHSDHNGRNFRMIRLDTEKFNHDLTGYKLSLPHSKKECNTCHNTGFIIDPAVRLKTNTFLGLSTECLGCHTDYHQQTLSSSCLKCHNPDSFRPATNFNHTEARFRLAGKHKEVECLKCHKTETVNGRKFQEFRGVIFSNCTSCHTDPHQNKFGQNCRQCHTEQSFQDIKNVSSFDHNRTNFRLEEKHQWVSCRECHKTNLTDPLKYDRCTDCHADYHKGQFKNNGIPSDCSQCHSVTGFDRFTYTVMQHNRGKFPLGGSHSAVPCLDCHKKQDQWSFREIGEKCKDCHPDVHQNVISTHYYPGENCRVCHNESRWSDVTFDHSKTKFKLTGSHVNKDCRTCHFITDEKGVGIQKFSGLSQNCSECHEDIHQNQFKKNGITDCSDCHDTENWKATKFNHNKTAFILDGQHINVPCYGCHKPMNEGSVFYVRYKLKEFKCESCHF